MDYRVFLVEDDNGTLQRLSTILDAEAGLSLVGTATNLADAMEWIEHNQPDVLLTDLGLPDGNGKQLIEKTRHQYSEAEIMVISRFGDENSVVEAIKAGAGGYLLKDEDSHHIIDSIHQLIKGASPISPAIARYILDYFQSGETAESHQSESPAAENLLTPKEKLVLQYISRGYANKEIASSLNISPHTVASHIKGIYRKLEVNSRNEAVFEGWRMGQLSIRQQSNTQQSGQKSPQQMAEALQEGGKSLPEIMEVLTLVFGVDIETGMRIGQQLGYSSSELFLATRQHFNVDDKQVIQGMLALGFSHEEALQAMLDQI